MIRRVRMTVAYLKKRMDARFGTFERRMNRRFEKVSARFDGIDARLDAVDARFDAVDACFDAVDARFDAMDARFDHVDRRFDSIGDKLDAIMLMMNRNHKHHSAIPDEHDRRLNDLEQRVRT